MPTALFIKNMDEIFNTMYYSIRFPSRPNGNAITSENICHLKDAIEILKNIKPVNGRKLPCINGWIITLSSTIQLWNDINETYDYLLTSRLNQDSIENLFSIIPSKGS